MEIPRTIDYEAAVDKVRAAKDWTINKREARDWLNEQMGRSA